MQDGSQNRSGRGLAIASEVGDAFEIVGGSTEHGLVIVCDHASNALPAEYGTLGLPAAELSRHIAYDIGAAGVTRILATALGVPAVLTRYSRLLIDVNRGEDDPTLVMRLSDGAIIPGNRRLDAAERDKRIERYYRPYDRAISRTVEGVAAAGKAPLVLGIHSFTESWKGVARPWAASVLWERDARFATPLLAGLRADAARSSGMLIGENEPYPGQYEGDTLWRHAVQRGLAFAIVELRQDLIAGDDGQQAWAERLARVVRPLLP